MSKTATQIAAEDIYPALYPILDQVIPEFGFRQFNKGWVSTTSRKVDGSDGETGKVYVYEDNISRLKDYTRASISIWDYLMERDGISTGEAFQLMAKLAGVTLPGLSMSPEESERVAAFNRQVQLWEDLNTFFVEYLHGNNQTTRSQQVTQYLLETRGYKQEYFRRQTGPDLDNPKMEAGVAPALTEIEKFLRKKGYTESEILNLKANNPSIGLHHTLSFPYRDSIGRARGMVFRSVTGSEPKYLYSHELKRNEILFNLKPIRKNTDLVIVEGVLDALHATAAGVDNVVAVGGSSLSKSHVELAIKGNARRITLAFDNDDAGREGTLKALELIASYPQLKPFVVTIPGAKDPDEAIRLHGADAFKKAIDESIPGYLYQLNITIEKYSQIQRENGEVLNQKQVQDLLEDVQTVAIQIVDPLDKDRFIHAFLTVDGISEMGITRESLSAAVDAMRYKATKEVAGQELGKLLDVTRELQKQGKPFEALEILTTKAREIKSKDREAEFGNLLTIPTETEISAIIKGEPDGLKSGYKVRDGFSTLQDLELPAGALSIIAARTSHRKTCLMMNMAINIVNGLEDQPGREIHFFSYEESREAILCKLMNIFIDQDLRPADIPGTTNLKYIKGYFKKGAENFRNKRFLDGKEAFFRDLINTGKLRIHYSTMKGPVLADAIRSLRKNSNVGAIFIDYIQLLSIDGKFQSKQLELQEVCATLRKAAVETGLPVILGAQFNRKVEQEGDIESGKLRECGDIEQDADLVLGLWDRRFTKDGHRTRSDTVAKGPTPGELYIEVLKGRSNGAGSSEVLSYDGNTWKVKNWGPVPGKVNNQPLTEKAISLPVGRQSEIVLPQRGF